jgi:hypothetical protein
LHERKKPLPVSIFHRVASVGATFPWFDVMDEGIRMKNLKTLEHDKGGI